MSTFYPDRCPECGRPLEPNRTCPCQEKLRWNEFTSAWPTTRNAWFLVLLGIPAMFLLCVMGWSFDHLNFAGPFLGACAVGVPLLVQLVPTGRRRGGCFLGCWLVAAAWVGMVCATALLASHAPPWKREHAPAPRMDPAAVTTCGGLSLEMPRATIENRLGSGQTLIAPEGYVRKLYDGGRYDVTYQGEMPVRISGPTLEQNGKVLISVGDSKARRVQLFYKGSEGQVFPLEKSGSAEVIVACPADRVTSLVLLAGKQPHNVRHP